MIMDGKSTSAEGIDYEVEVVAVAGGTGPGTEVPLSPRSADCRECQRGTRNTDGSCRLFPWRIRCVRSLLDTKARPTAVHRLRAADPGKEDGMFRRIYHCYGSASSPFLHIALPFYEMLCRNSRRGVL